MQYTRKYAICNCTLPTPEPNNKQSDMLRSRLFCAAFNYNYPTTPILSVRLCEISLFACNKRGEMHCVSALAPLRNPIASGQMCFPLSCTALRSIRAVPPPLLYACLFEISFFPCNTRGDMQCVTALSPLRNPITSSQKCFALGCTALRSVRTIPPPLYCLYAYVK